MNRLQLAVFGTNVSHGCTISTAPGGVEVEWAETVMLARLAEQIGIEALIPVCRWKGFGGPSDFNARTFETYTWAAGLAQATSRIKVFATTAVPSIHPVLAAKQGVTIDHISGGRFGLNVVAGWNAPEVEMFGTPQLSHVDRYAYADEWMSFIKQLWRDNEPFDFSGKFFNAPGCIAEPKPQQQPWPRIMSAGVSPAGRRFAAKHADMNFILAPNLEHARATVADVQRIAQDEFSRQVEVWGNAAIFCRATHSAAEAHYRDVIHTHGDLIAAGNLLDTFTRESGSQIDDPALREQYLRNMMAGYSGFPVVGTPAEVADFLEAMVECGMAGATLSWPDYAAGLTQFATEILPLLEARGLRQPV
ncbi:MAG: LLM class flavin-dependent oxidoreductase [Gammaproteobacteria bacterium]|nr:LLM class flavin-dependent oxidoreductase [Gammaproteobacteria bacterium]